MTEPLTPADCDLRDFAFMPLDVARLRDSDLASDEPPEACWAAVLLWCASWHQVPAASIPNSEAWIAKAAGYLSRGKIDPAWKRVRSGAMRGWVECDDGRLYHPVVAEKARDAWRGKLEQRWRSECARIRKHNERHGTSVPTPQMDAWISGGCVPADFRNVTCDKTPMSHGQAEIVTDDTPSKSHESHAENASKRQGERKGQGQGEIKEKEKEKAPAAPAPLPDWMPEEAWRGFLAMRTKIRKPPTDRAKELLIAKLDAMREGGDDIAAVLDQSTLNGWQDLFPLKTDQRQRHAPRAENFASIDYGPGGRL